jgi:hypothetical protein
MTRPRRESKEDRQRAEQLRENVGDSPPTDRKRGQNENHEDHEDDERGREID